MTKSRAIKEKCRDCSGNQWKEVLLCPIIDCPLWGFRLGVSPSSKAYKQRMERARERFRADLEELAAEGLDIASS